nr:hypothetical protein [Tanacetum cinerariifolium]
MCINCTYEDGKPVTCCVCEGPLRGGFFLFCDSKAKNSFTYDPNAYSFNDTSSNFNHLLQPQYETYLCELCGNNSHYGYDCQQQFSFVYEQEPSYNQNYNENPTNEIAALNSNQVKEKPPQDSNIRQTIREECCIEVCKKQKQNMEDTMLELVEVCHQKVFYYMHNNVDDLIESALNSKLLLINLESQRLDKKKQEVKNVEEQPTKCGTRYKHLSTIPETKSDEVIKSSVKNLVQIPSEYEVTSDDESDMPITDGSSLGFTTFSNLIFDCNDDFTSSDDESLPDRDVPIKYFKVYSNPLFDDDEINSNKLDPHCFNAESDFVDSLSNRDTLIDSSPKFDFLEEFSGALMPTSIVNEERIRREHEECTSLMEKLFSINSVPRPMENFHTIVETLPTSPIPVQDSVSQREEIDIFTGTDDLLPPSIKSDNYDSEGDIHFIEELLVDDSISILENESSNFDHQDNPLFSHPPPEPSDVEFFEPNSGEVISVVINNLDEFNEDECFDP